MHYVHQSTTMVVMIGYCAYYEACLRFVIYVLVFILCEKTGTFFHFFKTLISTLSQIKTKTYIKILRHASPRLNLMNACYKFGRVISNSS